MPDFRFVGVSNTGRTVQGVIAADTGGAIKQNHIDVFIGISKNNPFS